MNQEHFVFDPSHFHSVSVSGGNTSAYMARHVQLANPDNPNICYLFANTGLEHALTYEFLGEMVKHWDLPLVALEYIPVAPWFRTFKGTEIDQLARRGEPFAALMKKEGFWPDVHVRLCTSRLKIRTIHRFIKANMPEGLPKQFREVIGFRADEAHRAKQDGFYPLIDANITRPMILDWWKEQPFRLKLPIGGKKRETILGNCQLCFLKGRGKLFQEIRVLKRTGQDWVIDF